jgi:hypothetical protein
MPTISHTKPGYRATAFEGEFRIHNVPVFVECKRGDFEVNARWIKAAVDYAKQQQRDNYYPPLHVIHHGDGQEVTHAGWFEIRHAAPITLKARRLTAVYADLVITNPEVVDLVVNKRLPYRSVEIFDPEGPPVIDTVALLDHEPPYHELPMLFVSDVDDQTSSVQPCTFANAWTWEQRETPKGVVACFRKIRRHVSNDMATTTEATKPEDFGAGVEFADDNGDDKKDKDNGEKAQESDGLDVSGVVKAIESGEISIADMDLILAAIQSQGAAAEPEAEEPAPAAVPGGGEAMKKTPEQLQAFAKMQGKIDALELKDKARDDADKRRIEVAEALQRLEGRPLGADLEARLTKFHQEHGSEAFKPYVEAMEMTAPAPISGDAGERFIKQMGNVPEVAMKYQEYGTDAVDKAAKFAREWDELRTRGLKVTLENYVAGRMAQTAAQEN